MSQRAMVNKILENHVKAGLSTKAEYGEHPLLSTENIKAEAVGARLGLSENEISDISPKLKEIHEELSQKLNQPDALKQEMMAWMTLWDQDASYIEKIQSYADEIRKNYTEFLVIGIGGSSLGAKALLHSLNYMEAKPHTPRIFFLENADAETLGLFENRLKESYGKVDYGRVAVNVISKSGTTAETSANFEVVLQHMKSSGLSDAEIAKRVIATTDPQKGTLRKIALEKGYRILIVPDGVGGRFSVFSDVGLLPLAVGGVDIKRILKGVKQGYERSRLGPEDENNHAYRIGSLLYLLDTRKGVCLHGLFLYGEAFEQIAAWFEQLWAESLGKNGKGPRPMGMIGTRAQHGVHQDNLEGKPNKVILFVGVQEGRIEEKNISAKSAFGMGDWKFSQVLYAGMNTAIQDLRKRSRPSMTWLIPKINEESLAEFLYTLEVATHVAGRLYGENPYDQPAVEEAKIGARKALSDAQKLPSSERMPRSISDFQLKTDQALSGVLGAEHGVSPEEIVSVHKLLEKVHSNISKVLKGDQSLRGAIQWLNQTGRLDFSHIQALAQKLTSGHEIICIAGIGGAISGAKAIIQALSYLNVSSKSPEIFYLENSDAESLALLDAHVKARCHGKLDFSKVAVNVISQSGETAETLAMFEALLDRYQKSNVTDEMLKQKIVISTNEKQGKLLAWGKKTGCPVIYVPSDIMGVLCVFGNMGVFPLALAGLDIQKFVEGVRKAQERALSPLDDASNHAFRLAELFYLLDMKKGKDKHGFFIYSDALKGVADWIEQLWAEAFGKSEKVGPRPLNMIGTTAQHSVNQDNIAGKNDKAILFVGVQKPRIDFKMPGESVDYLADNFMSQLLLASLEGTRQALTARQRPNMLWMIPEINEERLGELMFTLALTAMIAGDLYGVNPYVQPALEEAKKMLARQFASL